MENEYAGSMALQEIIDCDRRIAELQSEREASMRSLAEIMRGMRAAVCRAMCGGVFRPYLLRIEPEVGLTITEIDEVK